MATFTITTNQKVNTPPYQIGSLYKTINNSENYIFNEDDFLLNTIPIYKDAENDDILKIKILSIIDSNIGTLTLNNVPVNINDEILMSDIISGLLVYKSSILEESIYTDIFTFDVADTGSEEYGKLEGIISISVNSKSNNPPSEVGDNEITIDYGEILIFTREMFTTNTTPPYSDPENDSAFLLKILSLPEKGALIYNENIVNIDDIIRFDDIDNGLFYYQSDNSIIQADEVDFNFSIADEGSGIFIE